MRMNADHMTFGNENRTLFPIQYPAVMGMLGHGVRAVYARGVVGALRKRGLPYSISTPATTELVAEKFQKDMRARRFFACPTKRISPDTPIEATPTTAVEKKTPDRTISADRRVIADMRRANVGFESPQYYPARAPSIESITRLLVSMAATLPGFDVEMAKKDIASSSRLLRLNPALALLMCTELPGGFLWRSRDLVIFTPRCHLVGTDRPLISPYPAMPYRACMLSAHGATCLVFAHSSPFESVCRRRVAL